MQLRLPAGDAAAGAASLSRLSRRLDADSESGNEASLSSERIMIWKP